MERQGPLPVRRRARALVLAYGIACHLLFAAAVGTMVVVMLGGMQGAWGRVPSPLAWVVNLLLLLQFPLGHSFLLARHGRGFLARLAPGDLGSTLAPTTYVVIAALQVLALFLLWTPSGIVWFEAEGPARAVLLAANVGAWLLLGRAIFDAGLSLQTGYLGWSAAWRGRPLRWPAMPEQGLFRRCRQPIYVAFALTTWTVPVWTPDQLILASGLTLYCVLGPLLKEARWARLFGPAFLAYQQRVPYWIPWPAASRRAGRTSAQEAHPTPSPTPHAHRR